MKRKILLTSFASTSLSRSSSLSSSFFLFSPLPEDILLIPGDNFIIVVVTNIDIDSYCHYHPQEEIEKRTLSGAKFIESWLLILIWQPINQVLGSQIISGRAHLKFRKQFAQCLKVLKRMVYQFTGFGPLPQIVEDQKWMKVKWRKLLKRGTVKYQVNRKWLFQWLWFVQLQSINKCLFITVTEKLWL